MKTIKKFLFIIFCFLFLKIEVMAGDNLFTFSYTGASQEFTAPADGDYEIELWGASGGNNSSYSGRGGYTKGTISLKKGQKLYVYVGGTSGGSAAGYNGGGKCTSQCTAGGGATDVRYFGNVTLTDNDLLWDSTIGLRSRIMVAAGGGGLNSWQTATRGGVGGGLVGGTGILVYLNNGPKGGSQVAGGDKFNNKTDGVNVGEDGSFGKGGNAGLYSGGGGGGYYGGGGGSNNPDTSPSGSDASGGGGGSSYISGHTGCIAINSKDDEQPKSYCSPGTSFVECSYHYSNLIFRDTVLKSGSETVPNHKVENGTMTGNLGNGFARIKLVKKANSLIEINVKDAIVTPEITGDLSVYEVLIPNDDFETVISVKKEEETIWVDNNGIGEQTLKVGREHNIITQSEDGTIRIYTLVPTLAKASLDDIHFAEIDFNDFNKDKYEYNIEVGSEISALTPIFDTSKGLVVKNDPLNYGENIIQIKAQTAGLVDAIYTFKVTRAFSTYKGIYDYSYTGGYQVFEAPKDGDYILEVWGAQGGGNHQNSELGIAGKGGYSKGTVTLTEGEKLYIYVGGAGSSGTSFTGTIAGGYNGGGYGWKVINSVGDPAASGGGGTDIRVFSGEPTTADLVWNSSNGLNSRLIVAGGGGGAGMDGEESGSGGGINGIAGNGVRNEQYTGGDGGRETSGFAFGYGCNATTANGSNSTYGGPGGGGGWYGGKCSAWCGSGGGSGYVWTEATKNNTPGTYKVAEKYYLKDARTVAGNEIMPTHDGTSTMTGNTGNGYARISFFEDDKAQLISLTSTKGTMDPTFEPQKTEYTLSLNAEDTEYTLIANLNNDNAMVLGTGTFKAPNGEEEKNVLVVHKNGIVEIYSLSIQRTPSTSSLLQGIKINGSLLEEFDDEVFEYTITLPIETSKITIEPLKTFPNQTIIGSLVLNFTEDDLDHTIFVEPEDKSDNTPYIFHFKRARNSLLKTLNILDAKLESEFNPYKLDYDVKIPESKRSLNLQAEAFYNDEATITYINNGYISLDDNLVEILVEIEGIPSTTYKLHLTRVADVIESEEYDFDYTGSVQVFEAPFFGDYALEVWGAQGGGNHQYFELGAGGKGGYSKGTVRLQEGEKLYIYVGGKGSYCISNRCTVAGGFNGGGSGSKFTGANIDPAASGGGGTDIRIFTGGEPTTADLTWNSNRGLNSRFIVAGGGGGGGMDGDRKPENGGAGGGTVGINANNGGIGGTEVSGYAFGSGCNASIAGGSSATYGGPGGGGGWWGGRCQSWEGSGGGSGFIWNSDSSENVPDGYTVSTDYYLKNAETIAGNTNVPTYDGTGFMAGNAGNGFAKITAKSIIEGDAFLESLELDDGTIPLEFNTAIEEYEVTLPKEKLNLKITAVPKADTSVVTGDGVVVVPSGEETFEIVVTAKEGNKKVYKIKTVREKSADAAPIDIELKMSQSYLCDAEDGFCNYTFSSNTLEYEILLPFGMESVTLNAILKTEEQTVTYKYEENGAMVTTTNNTFTLKNGLNKFEVSVTSEDGNNTNSYVYKINRDDTGNNFLRSLTITDPSVSFDFNPQTYEYYLTLPNPPEGEEGYTSYTIHAEADGSLAEVELCDSSNLSVGMNDCNIVVRAENGKTRTYIIHMYKEKPSQIYLASLTVKDLENHSLGYSPTFNKTIMEYSLTVEADISEINVDATFEETPVSVTGIGNHPLVSGMNKIEISSMNNKNEIFVTTLYVNKKKSSNSTLENITITGYNLEPSYTKGVNEYSVTIPKNVTSLEVLLEHDETITTMMKGNTNLVNKNSDIIITSIAEDKTYQIYTSHVTKEASENNKLKTLTVSDGTLKQAADPNKGFESDVTNYTVEVESDVNNITISGELDDEKASVTGLGTYALSPGSNNIFNINVTSEAGETKTYTITVTKKFDNDTSLIEIVNNRGSAVKKIDDTHYQINVQYEIDSIEVKGIPLKDTTTVEGNGTYTLETGNNNVKLTSRSQAGTTEDYYVQVVRDKSELDDLKFLYVEEGGLSPSFSETTIFYDVRVPYAITSLDDLHIEAVLESENALYEIVYPVDKSLTVDEPKELVVRVYAEKYKESKEKYKDYTIRVTRQAENNKNLDLLTLETSPTNITGFRSDVTNYQLTVANNVDKLTVTASAFDAENVNILGLGDYDLKVGKNLISVFVIDKENGFEKSYQIVVTKNKSNNAKLKNVTIEGTVLSFKSDVTDYAITTSKDKLNFTSVIPVEKEATYKINGNENFSVGENTVTITVTAPDKETTKTYTFTVIKEASGNNNLSKLEVVGYTLKPVFHKGVTYYTTEVENDVNTIQIIANPEDPTAKSVTGTGIKNVSVGTNTFEVEVTSAKDTVKKYVIVVTKNGNTNNYLSSLTVSDGILYQRDTDLTEFDKNVLNYKVTVPYEVDKITVNGTFEVVSASTTDFKEYDLNVGTNEIKISVLSESGSIRIYNIEVTREANNSALLKSITVKNYDLDPEFDPNTLEYVVNVDNDILHLDLSIVPEAEGAEWVVVGNDLEDGFVVGMNEVTIVVTPPDGDQTKNVTYTLYVNRSLSANNYLDNLEIDRGTLEPVFSPTEQNYSVTVERDITKINIDASVMDVSATITEGIGEHDLALGSNTIQVKVKSSMGVFRTYTITVERKRSENNNLLNLEVLYKNLPVSLDKEFKKTDHNYSVAATSDMALIEISATKEDQYAKVVGTGSKILKSGTNTFDIIVTSESGVTNTYTITLEKALSDKNKLENIIPSVGTLKPTFNADTRNYTLELKQDETELSFTVQKESDTSTVTGIESLGVPEGESTRIITVIAENGDKREYEITVTRKSESEARLESLTLQGYEFEFDPNTFTYNISVSKSKKTLTEEEITAIAMDVEGATVNKMGDIDLIDGMINVYTIEVIAKDGVTTQPYTLNITRDSTTYSLMSDVYDIVRDNTEDYVIGILPSTSDDVFKGNFTNESTMLHVYKETTELEDGKLVATEMIVKLESEDYVYDILRIIVRGDLTKDGKVDITDQVKLINYVGKAITFNRNEMLSGDLTFDGRVDITDQVKLINYVGKAITSINPIKVTSE